MNLNVRQRVWVFRGKSSWNRGRVYRGKYRGKPNFGEGLRAVEQPAAGLIVEKLSWKKFPDRVFVKPVKNKRRIERSVMC